ncbi:hypothetical protein, partial [Riemerella anatipestifer]|uniref:hypothetical protein n=1 Tax=Riemerella anatipestifer TaxID=34085 RepID=UPI0021F8E4FF
PLFPRLLGRSSGSRSFLPKPSPLAKKRSSNNALRPHAMNFCKWEYKSLDLLKVIIHNSSKKKGQQI